MMFILFKQEYIKKKIIMKDSSKNLKYYLYYKDKDGYHIFLGISKNKNNMKKIEDSFEVLSNI